MSIKDKYVFITNKNEDMQCIGIKEGKFSGVVYRYGKVALGEETWDGNLPFRFEYDILDNNMIPREEFDDDNFNSSKTAILYMPGVYISIYLAMSIAE